MDDIPEARLRVIEAAQGLLNERGYNAVTMKDIADSLDIKAASLYYHFPQGKEEMFAVVTEYTFMQHHTGMMQALAAAGDSLPARLLAIANWFGSQKPLNLLAMVHSDMPAVGPEARERIEAALYRCIYRPVFNVFDHAQRTGESRPVDPDIMTGTFLSLIDGIYYATEAIDSAPPFGVTADQIIDVLVEGLRPR
ncbi:MAG: TetR/AcrR family transcriptional regulator [Chloroflexi bacterium]|nr:TetR/AcrR family transcriptional regulator [Chloroflexota bacterium]